MYSQRKQNKLIKSLQRMSLPQKLAGLAGIVGVAAVISISALSQRHPNLLLSTHLPITVMALLKAL